MKEQSVAELLAILRCSESVPDFGNYRTVTPGAAANHSLTPRIAIGAGGTVHVLLPLPPDAAVLEDKRSGGVHLVRHEMILENGDRRVFADLVCLKGELEPTFSQLADEVLRQVSVSRLRADAVARSVLAAWRHLLDKDAGLLSASELLGLFGELWTLHSLGGNARALQCWTGGARFPARHDFRMGPDALEVKTSISTQKDVVHIHGLEQMAPPANGRLFLRRIRVEATPTGFSVPDLVERLKEAGVPALDLLEALVLRGYDSNKADEYRLQRFDVRDDSAWAVSGCFPRLLATHFIGGVPPAGVHINEYEIDLSCAAQYKLKPAQFAAEMKQWSEGICS